MIGEYKKRWVIKALNDYGVAQHEIDLPENEMTTDAIFFHCQQTAEKLFKHTLFLKMLNLKKSMKLSYF